MGVSRLGREQENGKPAGVNLTPAEFLEFISRFDQVNSKLSQALLMLAKQGQELRDVKELIAKCCPTCNLTEPHSGQAQHCPADVQA